MKKSLLTYVALGLLLGYSSIAMAAGGAPGAGIGNTYHDLSSLGKGVAYGDPTEQTNLNRICIYCHAPHNTVKPDSTNTYMPLWNHGVTTQVFNMYANTVTGDTPGSIQHQSQAMLLATAPGTVSMLCLSCHDGTVATNQYGMNSSVGSKGANNVYIPGGSRASIGFNGDLSNHHPIGFDYQSVITGGDDEINPVTTAVGAGGLHISDLLQNGRIECASCHDVHNTKNSGEKFLWISDTQSKLCLTCHKKNG